MHLSVSSMGKGNNEVPSCPLYVRILVGILFSVIRYLIIMPQLFETIILIEKY